MYGTEARGSRNVWDVLGIVTRECRRFGIKVWWGFGQISVGYMIIRKVAGLLRIVKDEGKSVRERNQNKGIRVSGKFEVVGLKDGEVE